MMNARIQSIGLAVFMAFTTLLMAPMASTASTQGRRNTAIGLSAGALYSALKGRTGAAIALGAGAAYAWKRAADSRRHHVYYHGQRPYYGYGRYGRGPAHGRRGYSDNYGRGPDHVRHHYQGYSTRHHHPQSYAHHRR